MTKMTVKKYQDFKTYTTHYMVTILKDGMMDFNESVDDIDTIKAIANQYNVSMPEGI